MQNLQSLNIVVIGLGITGNSVVRFLLAHDCRPTLIDTRSQPPIPESMQQQVNDLPHHFGEMPLEVLLAADLLVVSPGVALSTTELQMAMDAGVEVIGDIELFARFADAPVIAITGSNGKSTVTTLVAEMARAAGTNVAVGGNIGTPALDLLSTDVGLYVLELSSFQLETTQRLNCRASTVLNVSADHMDRYSGLFAYQQAKLKIYENSDVRVVNRDDSLTQPNSDGTGVRQISFGAGQPSGAEDFGLRHGSGRTWLCRGNEKLLSSEEVRLVGEHNLLNALAALALGEAAGLPMEAMFAALRTFAGLAHRCQHIADKAGVTYVNDSKATNVGATIAALEGLAKADRKLHLIAGGDAKGADLSPLKAVLESHVTSLITLGKDGADIARLKAGAIQVNSLEKAVEKAATMAEPGDLVLLSPACASLDMFANFEQRGDRFAAAVEALPC